MTVARTVLGLGRLGRALRRVLVAAGRRWPPSRAATGGSTTPVGDDAPELREVRELIDEVDAALVALLARRAELARRAASAKATLGRGILDHRREAALLASWRARAEALGLDPASVEDVFRAVVRFSRRAQARRG